MCTKRLLTTFWGQNLDFLLLFFYWFFKKINQNWEFWSVCHFLKKCLMPALKLGYRHIVDTFKCVWKMSPAGQICGPFLAPNSAEICQYVGFRLFPWKFSPGITRNLIYYHIGAIFCRCVCSIFCNGFLVTKNRSKWAMSEVFRHFLKKFLMPDPKTWFTGIL